MTIIAHQGVAVYLVEVDAQHSRVLDLAQGRLFPPMFTAALAVRGGWEPYHGPQDILPRLLAQVQSMAGNQQQ